MCLCLITTTSVDTHALFNDIYLTQTVHIPVTVSTYCAWSAAGPPARVERTVPSARAEPCALSHWIIRHNRTTLLNPRTLVLLLQFEVFLTIRTPAIINIIFKACFCEPFAPNCSVPMVRGHNSGIVGCGSRDVAVTSAAPAPGPFGPHPPLPRTARTPSRAIRHTITPRPALRMQIYDQCAKDMGIEIQEALQVTTFISNERASLRHLFEYSHALLVGQKAKIIKI